MKYEAHELASLFPRMSDAAFKELIADVRRNGLVLPITLYEGKILDGIHRQDACLKAKINPDYVEYDGDDPVGFVISTNLARRHLNESERAMVAAKLVIKRKQNKKPPKGGKKAKQKQKLTEKKAAKLLKVGERSVNRATKVIEHGDRDLQKAVETGAIKLKPAAEIAKLPKPDQPAAIKRHTAETHRKRKPKPATLLDLNAAWNRSDFEQRRRFIDGIGVQVIWDAMPEHHRLALETIFTNRNERLFGAACLAQPEVSTDVDLTIPRFLRRQ